MGLPLKKPEVVYIFALVFFISVNSYAQDFNISIEEITLSDSMLVASISFDSLFTDKIVEGLERGLTVQIKYEIELWQPRKIWFDKYIISEDFWFKVLFNRWQKKYIISMEEERRSTSSFERVKEICAFQKNHPVRKLGDIQKNKNYYLVAKCSIKPLDIENIEEMSNWLKGGEKKDEKNRRGVTSKIIEFVSNVTGFGAKYFSVKSRFFKIDDKNNLIFEN